MTDLPATLAGRLDGDHGTLLVRSADLPGILRDLVGWAERHHLDLTGLEVGPPSLEDAYLAITAHPPAQEPARHG